MVYTFRKTLSALLILIQPSTHGGTEDVPSGKAWRGSPGKKLPFGGALTFSSPRPRGNLGSPLPPDANGVPGGKPALEAEFCGGGYAGLIGGGGPGCCA